MIVTLKNLDRTSNKIAVFDFKIPNLPKSVFWTATVYLLEYGKPSKEYLHVLLFN